MVSDEALKKLQEQVMAWPITQRFVVQQLIEDYSDIRKDLLAYKNTGLTPEEVERSKLEIEAGCVKAIARTYGIDINRLRKLAEADKDERVVVLPCKPGDTVYSIFGAEVIEKTVGRIIINGYTTPRIWIDLDYCTFLPSVTKRWDLGIGKDFFLTREEAKKALEGKRNA